VNGKSDKAYAEQHRLPRQYADRLLIVEKGSDVRLEDASGREYLDFASGIAVNALGYGRKELADIMAEQAGRLIHISNLFTTRPALELAGKLCASSPRAADQPWGAGKDPGYFKAVHFGNSGTEANEAALKYARAYHHREGRPRKRILAFENSFHGRTMGALSVTATEKYRKPFSPLVPGAEFAPFNDVAALRRLLRGRRGRRYAAVIVEVIQGEGGINAMTKEFAAALNGLCREGDIVLIADEVQTGLGRTGTLYASEAVGLEPDILTLSKPLAAGLPLSATLMTGAVNDRLHPGDHASTFGGGPVTTAVAGYVWDEITRPGFLTGTAQVAGYLERRLITLRDDFPAVFASEAAPRGRGMLRGLVVRDGDILPSILDGCMAEGLLVLRAGTDVLRLAPPLIIQTEHIDEMETKLRTVLGRIS
jgi:acetylornithine/N-succinyldiaminopimelate aminotransferase